MRRTSAGALNNVDAIAPSYETPLSERLSKIVQRLVNHGSKD